MHNAVKNSAALAALLLLTSAAFAQTPPPPPPAPAHQGIFSRLFHPKPKPGTPMMHHGMTPGRPGLPAYSSMRTPIHHGMMPGHSMMGGPSSMMGGQFIGNKNSHVYHMPGDKGSMPSPQNRVYFHSAAEAEAAGYHASGSGRSTTSHRTMMHGAPMQH